LNHQKLLNPCPEVPSGAGPVPDEGAGTLYLGDNLEILRTHIPERSADLIYLDPPFCSAGTYTLAAGKQEGNARDARIAAFTDVWRWDDHAERDFRAVLEENGAVAETARALRSLLRESGLTAYLLMAARRLLALRKALKPTGSLYLHCDPTAGHYLKIVADGIFGRKNFINEIIWHYTGGGRSKSRFSRKHDCLYLYAAGGTRVFNPDPIRLPYTPTSGYAASGITSKAGKRYLPDPRGKPPDDVWDIPIINPLSRERTGYPTQKPLALLERIVLASSNSGDVVLDPFCGSGTTLHAALKLGRRWIGIDNAPLAVQYSEQRLRGAFPDIAFTVHVPPKEGVRGKSFPPAAGGIYNQP
jgi:site-specific DNA-methyltransferase (adenine-specific)